MNVDLYFRVYKFSRIYENGPFCLYSGRHQNLLDAAPIFSSQLQPTYIGKLCIAVECCIILAAASGYEFLCLPLKFTFYVQLAL